MRKDRRDQAEDSEYEHYNASSIYDPGGTSTGGPVLDIYLSTADKSEAREQSLRRQRRRWIWVGIGGALLLGIHVVVFLALSNSGPQTAWHPKERKIAPTPGSSSKEPSQPQAPNPRPAPSAGVSPNLVANLSKGVVFVHALDALAIPARGRTGSSGTGFIIDQQGHIITNEHVVSGRVTITVKLHDGQEQHASIMVADPQLDIAVLKIRGSTSLQALKLGDSDRVQAGEAVYALGFPLGSMLGGELTVTNGLVSSIRRRNGETWFQVSAAVNPGNSGGPLVRADTGDVVGVITSKLTDAELIAFARPINYIRPLLSKNAP